MIKHVEELPTELQRLAFGQPDIFMKRQIPVVEARTVKECPAGGPEFAQRFLREECRIEIGIRAGNRVIRSRVGNVEWTGCEVRLIDSLSGRAGKARAQQRSVIVLPNPYREARRKASHTGDNPAACEPRISTGSELIKGEFIAVAGYKIVSHIEGGNRFP